VRALSAKRARAADINVELDDLAGFEALALPGPARDLEGAYVELDVGLLEELRSPRSSAGYAPIDKAGCQPCNRGHAAIDVDVGIWRASCVSSSATSGANIRPHLRLLVRTLEADGRLEPGTITPSTVRKLLRQQVSIALPCEAVRAPRRACADKPARLMPCGTPMFATGRRWKYAGINEQFARRGAGRRCIVW
jgi:hypothetical protein